MPSPKILVLAGSQRKESFNRKLAKAAEQSLLALGAKVTLVEMADFPIPLFHQDEESSHGMPAPARQLQDLFVEHDGFLLASPEYNSSLTPLMKNTLDWVSRANGDRAGLVAFRGKSAALVSASAGALGGLRGLRHLREILANMGVLVLPGQFALSKANSAFDADGKLIESQQQEALDKVTKPLVDLLSKIG